MRIVGLKALKQSASWLRSRFERGALILGYHRVAEVTPDPYAMCVTPQHFAEQLEVLRRYAHPISLQQLVQGLRDGGLPRRAVVLTFDDGYADVYTRARPLLEQFDIPATVFIITGYLGREFWWDELKRGVLSARTLPALLALRNGATTRPAPQGGSRDPRRDLVLWLYRQLLPLAQEEREAAMSRLWDWLGMAANGDESSRALTADETIHLAQGGLVEVGAHSVTHPRLAALSAAAQQDEIRQSRASLEELLGRTVVAFSYPNGSASPTSRALVRATGFACACASFSDLVWRSSDRFYLPRFWAPDWDGDVFSRWLRGWVGHG